MSTSRGSGAAIARAGNSDAAPKAAEADRKPRRVIVMTWFPNFEKSWERQVNLPHRSVCGNLHGESILIPVTSA
jgi:hypothetical protein